MDASTVLSIVSSVVSLASVIVALVGAFYVMRTRLEEVVMPTLRRLEAALFNGGNGLVTQHNDLVERVTKMEAVCAERHRHDNQGVRI